MLMKKVLERINYMQHIAIRSGLTRNISDRNTVKVNSDRVDGELLARTSNLRYTALSMEHNNSIDEIRTVMRQE